MPVRATVVIKFFLLRGLLSLHGEGEITMSGKGSRRLCGKEHILFAIGSDVSECSLK